MAEWIWNWFSIYYLRWEGIAFVNWLNQLEFSCVFFASERHHCFSVSGRPRFYLIVWFIINWLQIRNLPKAINIKVFLTKMSSFHIALSPGIANSRKARDFANLNEINLHMKQFWIELNIIQIFVQTFQQYKVNKSEK